MYRQQQIRPHQTEPTGFHPSMLPPSPLLPQEERFVWTTGGDPDLSHKKEIDGGSAGVVHEVSSLHIRLGLRRVALSNFHWSGMFSK
jgi:hypothetical protein